MKPALDRRMFVLSLAALALSACGGSAGAAEPPKIAYGKDACARCRMIISEERQAAGVVAEDGTKTLFDDTGELVATVQTEGLNGRRIWVHDYQAQAWTDGTKAFYVAAAAVMTPMGTGVVAFKERAAADEFAATHGATAMSWQEVLQNWQIDKRMS
jgi:copper chaperone NosL